MRLPVKSVLIKEPARIRQVLAVRFHGKGLLTGERVQYTSRFEITGLAFASSI